MPDDTTHLSEYLYLATVADEQEGLSKRQTAITVAREAFFCEECRRLHGLTVYRCGNRS